MDFNPRRGSYGLTALALLLKPYRIPNVPPRSYPQPPPSNLPALLMGVFRILTWLAGGSAALVIVYFVRQAYFTQQSIYLAKYDVEIPPSPAHCILTSAKVAPEPPTWLTGAVARLSPIPKGHTGRDFRRATNCGASGLARRLRVLRMSHA